MENSQINLQSEQKFILQGSNLICDVKLGLEGKASLITLNVGIQLEMARRYFTWEFLLLSRTMLSNAVATTIAFVLSSYMWLLPTVFSDADREHFCLCKMFLDSTAPQ